MFRLPQQPGCCGWSARNLGLLLRKVWGYCKPRNAKTGAAASFFAVLVLWAMTALLVYQSMNPSADRWWHAYGLLMVAAIPLIGFLFIFRFRKKAIFLTGC